ncbi:hypothetical protein V2J09_003002 [Rumex salicifolius]
MASATFMAAHVMTPSSSAKVFKLADLPQQKLYNGVPFPLVLSPAAEAAAATSLPELVRSHKPWVEARLQEAGAVLFRGFHVPTAADFSDVVVGGFGYEEFPFKGLAAPRTHVVGPIYTSNDSPPQYPVHFHNEMAYLKDYPSKVFFYCEVEPESRGETPIVLGHIVYERLKKNHSEFLRRLEEHGFVYHKVLPHELDPFCVVGQSWKSTFSTHDKSIAEQRAAEVGVKLEWVERGAKAKMNPLAGIKVDERPGPNEGRKMWFNSLMPTVASHLAGITLGDGGDVPPELLEECGAILEEECVAVPWSHGDILMLDNWAVQHARRPFTPPRRVLAAFT